jgi:mannose-6-phosphate isomerase
MEEDFRPWGYYQVLADGIDHKVKKIVVYPGHRMSLQRHQHRTEHWYIIQGEAIVRKNDEEFSIQAGNSADIPRYSWHRITNPGMHDMIFIEVQRGDYFGEDDIERSEDDYGRAE